jgi:hypothetical protein
MDTPHDARPAIEALPGPLTPDKVRRARKRTAAIRDDLRRQGIDFSRLPDPVDELAKARDAGYREI